MLDKKVRFLLASVLVASSAIGAARAEVPDKDTRLRLFADEFVSSMGRHGEFPTEDERVQLVRRYDDGVELLKQLISRCIVLSEVADCPSKSAKNKDLIGSSALGTLRKFDLEGAAALGAAILDRALVVGALEAMAYNVLAATSYSASVEQAHRILRRHLKGCFGLMSTVELQMRTATSAELTQMIADARFARAHIDRKELAAANLSIDYLESLRK
jgi:hypothetical protein